MAFPYARGARVPARSKSDSARPIRREPRRKSYAAAGVADTQGVDRGTPNSGPEFMPPVVKMELGFEPNSILFFVDF
jgi:hypothetical protein